MGWKTGLPEKDGWYWVRSIRPYGGRTTGDVVNVMLRWVHSVISIEPIRLDEYDSQEIEWYGPIECPK